MTASYLTGGRLSSAVHDCSSAFRATLEQLKLSPERAAERIGVTLRTVQYWKNGHREPRLSDLMRDPAILLEFQAQLYRLRPPIKGLAKCRPERPERETGPQLELWFESEVG